LFKAERQLLLQLGLKLQPYLTPAALRSRRAIHPLMSIRPGYFGEVNPQQQRDGLGLIQYSARSFYVGEFRANQ
jgi:hypothetical protein